MDVTRHQGKTAIVTGAGSGIGRATVLRFAQEGARVVAFDRNQKGLDAFQAELETRGLKADFLRADVTSHDDIQRVVEVAGDKIDILANVAGIMDHFIPLGELDDDTWDRVIAVNLTGVMRLTRAVLPLMQAASGGAIVTVASKSSPLTLPSTRPLSPFFSSGSLSPGKLYAIPWKSVPDCLVLIWT